MTRWTVRAVAFAFAAVQGGFTVVAALAPHPWLACAHALLAGVAIAVGAMV